MYKATQNSHNRGSFRGWFTRSPAGPVAGIGWLVSFSRRGFSFYANTIQRWWGRRTSLTVVCRLENTMWKGLSVYTDNTWHVTVGTLLRVSHRVRFWFHTQRHYFFNFVPLSRAFYPLHAVHCSIGCQDSIVYLTARPEMEPIRGWDFALGWDT